MQRVKGSAFAVQDNFNYVSITDPAIGGIGDGATDNTTAITAALATGLPVFIPAGTFMTGPLTVPDNGIIFGSGFQSILKLKNTAGATPILTVGSGSMLRNFKLDGNKANNPVTTAHGVSFVNSIQSGAFEVTAYNCAGDGFNISGASTAGVKLLDCTATGFTKNGYTVENGSYITFNNCTAYSSDVVASPGDGFSLAPTLVGAALSLVTFVDCISRNNSGRGFSSLGFGSKNVTNVSYKGCIAGSNTSHGFHALTTQYLFSSVCIAKANGGDGFRYEGDTQFCRLSQSNADGNTGYGIREIVAASTPNNNKIIYSLSVNNVGSNTITIVGGASANVP